MVTIELPPSLVGENSVTSVLVQEPVATVREALRALETHSPAVLDRVLDEQGKLRQHVNVFLNRENTRFLKGLDTPTPEGSIVFIIGAISGG